MSKKSRPTERQSPQLQQEILRAWAERQARLESRLPLPINQATLRRLNGIRRVALQDPPVAADPVVNERAEVEHHELPQLPSDLALLIEVLDLADEWRARDSVEQRDFQRWREQQLRGERALHLRNVKARLERGALVEEVDKLRHEPGHRARSIDEATLILAEKESADNANRNDDEEGIGKLAKAMRQRYLREKRARKVRVR